MTASTPESTLLVHRERDGGAEAKLEFSNENVTLLFNDANETPEPPEAAETKLEFDKEKATLLFKKGDNGTQVPLQGDKATLRGKAGTNSASLVCDGGNSTATLTGGKATLTLGADNAMLKSEAGTITFQAASNKLELKPEQMIIALKKTPSWRCRASP